MLDLFFSSQYIGLSSSTCSLQRPLREAASTKALKNAFFSKFLVSCVGGVGSCRVFGLFRPKLKKNGYSSFNTYLCTLRKDEFLKGPEEFLKHHEGFMKHCEAL
jgi:hypothetical protein